VQQAESRGRRLYHPEKLTSLGALKARHGTKPISLPKIIRIPILPLGRVNTHLVISDTGCILVDAGLPGSERKIARVLAQCRLSLNDIKLIIVTHAHVAHAGSAARLRELSGAPILAHQDDVDFYSRRAPMTLGPCLHPPAWL
jgi:hydroxyacylglutathione hydrolase